MVERAQSASLRLSERSEEAVAAYWRAHTDGLLSVAVFRSLAIAAITEANTAGVQLADIAVTAEMVRQQRRTASPLGLRPTSVQVDRRRLDGDIDRILAEAPDVDDLAESREARLRRLARSEPLVTVASSITTAMVARKATGWTRLLDRDPCSICRSWADGVIRSPGTRMARHLGCGCIQQPVFT